MKPVLRRYQLDGIESAEEQLRSHRSTLGVMATGLGKTIVFADLIRRRAHLGRAMVLAHRKELIEQSAEKITWVSGLQCDIEMADRKASQLIKAPVVVSTIQTQTAGGNGERRMHQFDPGEFATCIVDEFHHAPANTYQQTIDHYMQNPDCRLFGVTATPKRTDKVGLGCVMESVAFNMGIVDGIKEGWLVPIKVKYARIDGLDLSNVGITGGDYTQRDLGAVMDEATVLKATALATLEFAENKKTLVFTASVQQAEHLTAFLNDAKPGSAHIVTGETPPDERDSIVGGFRNDDFQFLVNFAVFLEGFDVWDVACVVLARPTKNALLLEQMIGRGTRPEAAVLEGRQTAQERRGAILSSSKPDCTIVDFIGNVGDNRPRRVIDVLGGKLPDATRELAERELQGGCESVEEAIRRADAELQAQRVTLKGKARYAAIEVYDLFHMEHEAGESAVEQWQKDKLEKWRMPIPSSAEEAQTMIEEVRRRTRLGMCTFRMAKQLKRAGYDPDMPFDQARAIMDQLAKAWRR